ncbi:ABC transporter substrate-binding protein [Pseudomonas panipatensis]|uniref:ABC-type sugar transport system, substrate-binding protein, contains N-terminal xre family HTH domain n=1 Tax=Pseudomonas panipatensis TaxID=428992 RepID=A0A1G8FDX4_9PSED|nr:ABC-type sugar transport system, substrate-binding protein, contains N-terminal xre family HTH domain [Pseudomonas panipatensis]SMP54355.1 monosaccharide ABC transporter substrate-binding protein, CUT2 family [Pseudomonas panipatensis]
MCVLRKTLLLLLSLLLSAASQAASVVFLDPGRSDELYWVSYVRFMQAAADDLGMSLRVLHAERDPQRMLRQAREVLHGAKRPDYLVFVNENYGGPEILRLSAGTGVRLFAVNNSLTADQQRIAGGSRERYPNWIGSLVANDERAGYLMAKELLRTGAAAGWQLDLLAFSGVKQTPVAQLREQGLKRAMAEYPQARLLQMVYGGWARQRAYEQAQQLFKRYPQTRLVWAANDEMAFGAMQAASELGRVPGKDLLFSGLNNSPALLEAAADGRINAAVTGHFTLGGWAMVMLYDYHAGVDFAAHGGKDRQLSLFELLDKRRANSLRQNLARPGYGIDFRDFSLALHPEQMRYRFSLRPLID